MPTLEPALQLPVPQGILFTTPSPSAGLELLEAALQSGGHSPAQHPYKLPSAPGAVSWPPWTAPPLCSLPPRSTVPSALDACPQVLGFYSASWWPSLQTVPGPVPSSFLTAQMTQADMLGLMPSGTPAAASHDSLTAQPLGWAPNPGPARTNREPRNLWPRDPASGVSPRRACPCLQCPQWLLLLSGVLRWGGAWQGWVGVGGLKPGGQGRVGPAPMEYMKSVHQSCAHCWLRPSTSGLISRLDLSFFS